DPRAAYYRTRFDLSSLPTYQPDIPLTGTLRMPASGQLMQSSAGPALVQAFQALHPQLRVELTDGVMVAGQVHAPIGRKWTSSFAGEVFDFQQRHERSPVEIQLATGAFDVSGWSPALAVFVGRDNPIQGLTLRQLDGI